MHYGLQAIVLALSSMEVSAENKSSIDKESNSTAIYLQQLREHLDAITSPVRRVNLTSPFQKLSLFLHSLSFDVLADIYNRLVDCHNIVRRSHVSGAGVDNGHYSFTSTHG